MANEPFDMFSAPLPFTERLAVIMNRRSHVDPFVIYASLVVALGNKAIEVATKITPPTMQPSLQAVSMCIRYTIKQLESWDVSTVERMIDEILMRSMNDYMHFSEVYETFEQTYLEQGPDACAALKIEVDRAVEEWDSWTPSDEIIQSLKTKLVDTFDRRVTELESA